MPRLLLPNLRSRSEVDPKKVVYFGRSLGAAVAIELATRQPPAALVLEAPFPSIAYMARLHYPHLPFRPLLRNKYDSLSKIGDIDVPILVIHGDKDTVVPPEAGRDLFDAAKGIKRFYTIKGAGHNDTYVMGGQAYFEEIRRFLFPAQ